MESADTVMFAIQAGLRLYGATRKAYADSVRGHALTLPLPRAPGVGADSAVRWFRTQATGKKVSEENPRIAWLIELPSRTEAQKAELVDLYKFYRSQSDPLEEEARDTRGELSQAEMRALLEVRQWSDVEAGGAATPLQTVAGTLVNVAIDYFVQTPGAVSVERPEGRALKAFLEGLDQTNFATIPPTEIATGLMVAVLDSVSAHPHILGGGENERKLIANVSKSLSESAAGFLAAATDKQRRDGGVWLQLVGHAVLKGAAETVLAEPWRYFRVRPGAESEVVVEVGTTITNLLLGERALQFQALLSVEGLNVVTKSALAAVAKNPGLLKVENKGLENVIVALADEVARLKAPLSPDLFPEMVRLVLDKSADNLDLIWGKAFTRPERHLLVTAAAATLKSLARKPPAGSTWRPQFTPEQLMHVTEAVLDEVVDNPAWILKEAGEQSTYLEAAVEAILAALRRLPGDRISAQTGVVVLRAGIGAVALRLSLLAELPASAEEPAQAAITAALDAIFAEVFNADADVEASWDLARNKTLQTAAEIGLHKLARFGATAEQIETLRRAVRELCEQETPFDAERFAARLEDLLAPAA